MRCRYTASPSPAGCRSAAQTVRSLSLRDCVLAFSHASALTSTCSISLKSRPAVVRQAAIGTEWGQCRGQCLRRVALLALRVGLGRRQQLARGLCLLQQIALEGRFGNCGHRMHAVFVGQAAQIGDAVFVEVNVAQVARDGVWP